jgi:hypothetical protein
MRFPALWISIGEAAMVIYPTRRIKVVGGILFAGYSRDSGAEAE